MQKRIRPVGSAFRALSARVTKALWRAFAAVGIDSSTKLALVLLLGAVGVWLFAPVTWWSRTPPASTPPVIATPVAVPSTAMLPTKPPPTPSDAPSSKPAPLEPQATGLEVLDANWILQLGTDPVVRDRGLKLRYARAVEEVTRAYHRLDIASGLFESRRRALAAYEAPIREAVLRGELQALGEDQEFVVLNLPWSTKEIFAMLVGAGFANQLNGTARMLALAPLLGANYDRLGGLQDLDIIRRGLVGQDLRSGDIVLLKVIQYAFGRRLQELIATNDRFDALLAKCRAIGIPKKPDPALQPLATLFKTATKGARWPIGLPRPFSEDDATDFAALTLPDAKVPVDSPVDSGAYAWYVEVDRICGAYEATFAERTTVHDVLFELHGRLLAATADLRKERWGLEAVTQMPCDVPVATAGLLADLKRARAEVQAENITVGTLQTLCHVNRTLRNFAKGAEDHRKALEPLCQKFAVPPFEALLAEYLKRCPDAAEPRLPMELPDLPLAALPAWFVEGLPEPLQPIVAPLAPEVFSWRYKSGRTVPDFSQHLAAPQPAASRLGMSEELAEDRRKSRAVLVARGRACKTVADFTLASHWQEHQYVTWVWMMVDNNSGPMIVHGKFAPAFVTAPKNRSEREAAAAWQQERAALGWGYEMMRIRAERVVELVKASRYEDAQHSALELAPWIIR